MNKMEKCKIEFIKLIGTWPGGSQFVLGEYKVTFEKEIVRLHLEIIAESPEYKEMGEPSRDEMKPPYHLKRRKEGQEKFFRGKRGKIVIKALNRLGGIEGIKKLGCHRIPYSEFATAIIKGIKERKMKEEWRLSWSELTLRQIRLIKQDNEIRLNKLQPQTLWDLFGLRRMARDPEDADVWIWNPLKEGYELTFGRAEEKKRVSEEGLEKVEYALTSFEKLEIETKAAGKFREFEERIIDVIYPDPLGSAIEELKTWWKENRDGQTKKESE